MLAIETYTAIYIYYIYVKGLMKLKVRQMSTHSSKLESNYTWK